MWIRKSKRVNPMNKHKKKSGDIFIESLELCLISPSAVALRRELFDEFGMFDENLPVCEDYDLWLRITSKEDVGFIDEKLIVKYGGHDDQLSKRYWGMDRFRVYSIIKLLKNRAGGMKPVYIDIAIQSAIRKCGILHSGAVKRNNLALADNLKRVVSALSDHNYSSIDPLSLLEE